MAEGTAWTVAENLICAGTLPRYRAMVRQGIPAKEAAGVCASKVLDEDKLNLFAARKTASDPVDAVADRIRRLDELAAGDRLPETPDEGPWHKLYPREKKR